MALNVEIVISRYEENLDWLLDYSRDFKVTIYNKGSKITNQFSKNIKIKDLKNVGREGHTYLNYIIERYHTLPDVIIFLQGRIDDLEYPTFDNPDKFIAPAIKYGFSASNLIFVNGSYWLAQPFSKDGSGKHAEALREGKMLDCWETLSQFYYNNLGEIPLFSIISYCGCFAASKTSIQNKPKSFYSRLITYLNTHENPLAGHYIERIWASIFGNKYLGSKALGIPDESINLYKSL